jgi:hypothetical protein
MSGTVAETSTSPGEAVAFGFRIPSDALKDAGYIYLVDLPAFLIGSLW